MKAFKDILTEAMADWDTDPKYKDIKDHFDQAKEYKDIAKLKKIAYEKGDEGEWQFGPINYFWNKKKIELKNWEKGSNPADARMDRLLRIRDSNGKATARKFR